MIKNIIFDWSGVIKDSVATHLFLVNHVFNAFGVKGITLQEMRENWQQPYMDFYHKYLPNSVSKKQVEDCYRGARLQAPKAIQYPGIKELLEKIERSDKKMFILSSDMAETLYPEIEEFGMERFFTDVFSGEYDKTDSTERLISKNSLNKKETVIIGDTEHEVLVGKKSGIRTIAVTWGYGIEKKLKLSEPDFIVHNLKELESIILK